MSLNEIRPEHKTTVRNLFHFCYLYFESIIFLVGIHLIVRKQESQPPFDRIKVRRVLCRTGRVSSAFISCSTILSFSSFPFITAATCMLCVRSTGL